MKIGILRLKLLSHSHRKVLGDTDVEIDTDTVIESVNSRGIKLVRRKAANIY